MKLDDWKKVRLYVHKHKFRGVIVFDKNSIEERFDGVIPLDGSILDEE